MERHSNSNGKVGPEDFKHLNSSISRTGENAERQATAAQENYESGNYAQSGVAAYRLFKEVGYSGVNAVAAAKRDAVDAGAKKIDDIIGKLTIHDDDDRNAKSGRGRHEKK